MANYLAQFQSIKSSCDHIVIAVEDVSDLWPTVKSGFEERLPFKRVCLNNRTHNYLFVEKLPAEFTLTTDARLCSRFPHEQLLFWFREPYATVVLVTCEDLDEFKTILKPCLKLIVQNDEQEWFIVFVSKAHPNNDQDTKMAKKVYAKLEVDFNSKKRERYCKLDMHDPEPNFWEDLESKIMESIWNTSDMHMQFYEDELHKLINAIGKQREFGGIEHGDNQEALLNPGNKALTDIVQDDSFRGFEFRQYLFACQSQVCKSGNS